MNHDLDRLQPYPFEKLSALKAGVSPPAGMGHVALYIGEPRHPTPAIVTEALVGNLGGLSSYPATRGEPALRRAIADWLGQRFWLPGDCVDPDRHVLPVNGTREALFAFAQAVVDRAGDPLVVMPNPFYQIYEGAALLAGARPHFAPCTEATGWLPDLASVPADVWRRCQLVYVCSPGNPTGAVLERATLQHLIKLADEHDFVIASDECYSEIYLDEASPPSGLLEAAAAMGRTGFERCVAFHSLSKRSNAPGLRSGFVAGDARVLERFLLYRTYHGCAMSPPVQAASAVAWADEAHVVANRAAYREKFDAVLDVLGGCLKVARPAASFYLWPETPIPDPDFARGLYAQQNVTVLPGSFLSRTVDGSNPGAGRVRIALVAPLGECVIAAHRIRDYVESL
jgi:N-succinyldiaminopimelate aminotransferase